MKTIREILNNTQIDRLDAELLLAHVIQQPREFLIAHPEYQINKLRVCKVKKLIKKRERGVPLAYLTGHKEFYGLEFKVNKHTLIPRPDTEVMVELILQKLTKTQNSKTMLVDIGTGTGCIPISILKNTTEHIETYITDISRGALRIAHHNAKKYDVDIEFLHGNLLEPMLNKKIIGAIKKYDNIIITANLPYLTDEQFQKEFSIQYEPKSALVADNNGLALYEELFKQIFLLLTSYSLFLEINPSQTQQISNIIKKLLPNCTATIHKDLAGHDRIVEIIS